MKTKRPPSEAGQGLGLNENEEEVFGEMLELPDGCVCCSVRSDFALAIEVLLRKRKFDHVVLECSGLADPGALASMFWVDQELESPLYLDGQQNCIA